MFRHAIDICPDDAEELTRKLDSLAEAGSEVINVIWRPRRAEDGDQAAAFDTTGSFLIISRGNALTADIGLDDRVGQAALIG